MHIKLETLLAQLLLSKQKEKILDGLGLSSNNKKLQKKKLKKK